MNKVTRYAQIKIEIAKLEDELKQIKDDVFDEVHSTDGEKLETDFGIFEIRAGRKVWTYSDELIEKEKLTKEAIKLKKKEEELKGIAKLEEAPANLVFTMKKGE